MNKMFSSDEYLNFDGEVQLNTNRLSSVQTNASKQYAVGIPNLSISIISRPRLVSFVSWDAFPIVDIYDDYNKEVFGIVCESIPANRKFYFLTRGIVEDNGLQNVLHVGQEIYSNADGFLSIEKNNSKARLVGYIVQTDPCKIFINIPKMFDADKIIEPISNDKNIKSVVRVLRKLTFDIPFVDIKLPEASINYSTLIVSGNKIFAGGDKKAISFDGGQTWSSMQVPPNSFLKKIIHANDVFVGCLEQDGQISYSYDGSHWHEINVPPGQWENIAFGGGYFIVCARNGTTVLRSTNGIDWEEKTARLDGYNGWSIAYGNETFVIVGEHGGTSKNICSDDFGETWQESDLDDMQDWIDVTYGNGVFLAVRNQSADKLIISTSINGKIWQDQTETSNSHINVPSENNRIVFGDGNFVIACDGTNKIITSKNGNIWQPIVNGLNVTYRNANFSNGLFLLQGNGFLTRQILL